MQQNMGSQRVRHIWVTELTELVLIKRLLWWFTCLKIHLQSRKTWIQSLGWEAPLGKKMATYSSVPAWEIPWTEQPGGLQSMESHSVRHDLPAKEQQTM